MCGCVCVRCVCVCVDYYNIDNGTDVLSMMISLSLLLSVEVEGMRSRNRSSTLTGPITYRYTSSYVGGLVSSGALPSDISHSRLVGTLWSDVAEFRAASHSRSIWPSGTLPSDIAQLRGDSRSHLVGVLSSDICHSCFVGNLPSDIAKFTEQPLPVLSDALPSDIAELGEEPPFHRTSLRARSRFVGSFC